MPTQDRKIYVTTMYRFGEREKYSYPHHAGFSETEAIEAGKAEYKHRGHNYLAEVVVFKAGVPSSRKVVFTMLEDRKPERDRDREWLFDIEPEEDGDED